ncbi:hypothetical protein LS74_010740, partial [Helicobacter magdeburgensis]
STTNKVFNQDDTLIYTTIGNGKMLKEVVESGDKAQNKIQLRQATKEILNTLKNKEITHKNGIVARVSSVGIEKMMSDKAIQKSLDNGFSISQHFNAVQNIETLFKNSDFLRTEAPKNQSKDIVGVHRYINTENLQEQNAQALITLKESVENGNRIYSLELEELTHPTHLNRSPKSKGAEDSHHDDAGATNTARLFENPNADSTTNKVFNQDDTLIYTTIGNGKMLKEVVESGDKVEKVENIHNLRDELTTALTPILNKDITNISSGITAQVSKTSIKKMGSDKAINKSIENGFSLQEHFKASADIENLYKKATNIATTKDLKNGDPAIQMHTFISQVNDNANAKILVKESLDKDLRRIYTLELESLESTKPLAQVPNGDLADHLSKSKQKSDTSLTPLENVKGHSTTNKVFNQDDIKFDSLGDFERFARLSGFENLPQEKLQSAHKYILENLHKLEC